MENPTTEQAPEVAEFIAPQAPEAPKAVTTGPYAMFATDRDLEKKGIELEYEGFSITVARAGGSNIKYTKMLDKVSKPYRRAIANETIDPERIKKIFREVYAKSVVLGWKGMVDANGTEIPYTVANCIRVFEDLDDLFLDVQDMAQKSALFKKDITEGDLGN